MKMVIFIVDYNNKTCYGKILSYSIEICFYPKIGIDSSCIVYKGFSASKERTNNINTNERILLD